MKNRALPIVAALLTLIYTGCSKHTPSDKPSSTLESLTNLVRTVTPAPIISLNKRDKEGTRYLVTTDSPVEQREFALTWDGSKWQMEVLSVIPKR
jgi:hypothetical protein